jgi:hypothetical protein
MNRPFTLDTNKKPTVREAPSEQWAVKSSLASGVRLVVLHLLSEVLAMADYRRSHRRNDHDRRYVRLET